ncbi:hypothetical protein [Streptomyces subrutilus]|uniref:Uncharacterized protein n=1 Tax=Streptomyces subrutilus TaxID=36818 RepID=A0A1E5PMX3_9ACTN|nr:hypothetical protein BGK67_04505 [Streptomyces subrutilus]
MLRTTAPVPDGARLAGLGHTGGRGLCAGSDLRAATGGHTVVRCETHVPPRADHGHHKGQGLATAYAAGIAFTTRAATAPPRPPSSAAPPGGLTAPAGPPAVRARCDSASDVPSGMNRRPIRPRVRPYA